VREVVRKESFSAQIFFQKSSKSRNRDFRSDGQTDRQQLKVWWSQLFVKTTHWQ
jgi:hypothetical protein